MKKNIFYALFGCVCTLALSDAEEPEIADRFDYPIGNRGVLGDHSDENSLPDYNGVLEFPEYENSDNDMDILYERKNNLYPFNPLMNPLRESTYVGSTEWRNAQDVGAHLDLFNGIHAGEDWNKGSGDYDVGEFIYAIANGEVIDISIQNKSGFDSAGYSMVVRHTLPNNKQVDSVYVHVAPDKNNLGQYNTLGLDLGESQFSFQEGDAVGKGQVIAVLADYNYSAHLHFEMRSKIITGLEDPNVRDCPAVDKYWRNEDRYDVNENLYTPTGLCDHNNYGNGYYGVETSPNLMDSEAVKNAYVLMELDGIIDPSDFIDDNRGAKISSVGDNDLVYADSNDQWIVINGDGFSSGTYVELRNIDAGTPEVRLYPPPGGIGPSQVLYESRQEMRVFANLDSAGTWVVKVYSAHGIESLNEHQFEVINACPAHSNLSSPPVGLLSSNSTVYSASVLSDCTSEAIITGVGLGEFIYGSLSRQWIKLSGVHFPENFTAVFKDETNGVTYPEITDSSRLRYVDGNNIEVYAGVGIEEALWSVYIKDENGNSSQPRSFVVFSDDGGGVTPNDAQIEVKYGSINISNGDSSASGNEGTDFGDVTIGSSVDRDFVITNTGTDTLTIDNMEVDDSEFTVLSYPTSIAPGVSKTFSIRYSPTNTSADTATLSFETNDADKNPFSFDVKGDGVNTSSTLANLTGHVPSGWGAAIVVSDRQNTNSDSENLDSSDHLYLDWALINNGGQTVTLPFISSIYLNGASIATTTPNASVPPNGEMISEDISLGQLEDGVYTIRIEIDPVNIIDESNEDDNVIEKTFVVGSSGGGSGDVDLDFHHVEIFDGIGVDGVGNGDGKINPGEEIDFEIFLTNNSGFTLTNITSLLTTTSPYVNITDDDKGWSDMDDGETDYNSADFDFDLAPNTPTGTIIPFHLSLSTDQGDFELSFSLTVEEATSVELEFDGVSIFDNLVGNINQDGLLNPDETIDLDLYVKNTSGSVLNNVSGILTSSSDLVNILSDSSTWSDLSVAELDSGNSLFRVAVSSAAQVGQNIPFTLILNSDQGSWNHSFTIPVSEPSNNALFAFDSFVVNDNVTGNSSINNLVEAGETLRLDIILENISDSSITGINGVISSDSPYIGFTVDSKTWNTMSVGEVDDSWGLYTITISEDVPYGTVIPIDLFVTSNQGSWSHTFDLPVYFDLSTLPEVEVLFGNVNVSDQDVTPTVVEGTDFGVLSIGEFVERVFTISNLGGDTLSLENFRTNDPEFTVINPPSSLPVGASGQFTVRYSPVDTNQDDALVIFNSNDVTDGEGTYIFSVLGNGVALPEPEITVSYSGQDIPNQDSTPSVAEGTDFGSNVQIGSPVSRVFTITNTGDAVLTLSNFTVDGSEFTIQDPKPASVAVGGSETFTVQYSPTDISQDTATVSFTTNDSDENPFEYTVTGNGVIPPAPEIEVFYGNQNIDNQDSTPSELEGTDFGAEVVIGSSAERIFTIKNTGDAVLNLSNFTVDAVEFSIQDPKPASVAVGGSETFTVQYSPTDTLQDTATVSFTTNDSDENPFEFGVVGNGIVPNQAPSDVLLSSGGILENLEVGSEVGLLSAQDLDNSTGFTFSLQSGVGDVNNSLFSITGNSLR